MTAEDDAGRLLNSLEFRCFNGFSLFLGFSQNWILGSWDVAGERSLSPSISGFDKNLRNLKHGHGQDVFMCHNLVSSSFS